MTGRVSGSHVTQDQPYAIHGPWLQIFIDEQFIDVMLQDIQEISDLNEVRS